MNNKEQLEESDEMRGRKIFFSAKALEQYGHNEMVRPSTTQSTHEIMQRLLISLLFHVS